VCVWVRVRVLFGCLFVCHWDQPSPPLSYPPPLLHTYPNTTHTSQPQTQNVALLSRFLSPAGMIKPRRASGLCAKCQRKVARTVKQARHLGVLPHVAGVDLYRRLDPALVDGEGDGEGGAVLSRRGADGGSGSGSGVDAARRREALKRVPSVTI
jgi:ribosomal protein S18